MAKKRIIALEALLTIHRSFLMGCCTMLLMSVAPINRSKFLHGTANFQYVQLAAALFFLVGNFVANSLFKSALPTIQAASNLNDKLVLYKKVSICKFFIMALALWVIACGFFLTKHWSFFVLFFVQAIIYFSQRPHPILASAHLNERQENLYQ